MTKTLRPPRAPVLPALPEPRISGPRELPAARVMEVWQGKVLLARLEYHLTAPPLSVMQVLHLEVHPEHRRRKVATRLIEMALRDGQSLLSPERLRRVFVGVGHKSHLPMRALLTHLGFHHTSTIPGLLKGEDLLVYIKSFT